MPWWKGWRVGEAKNPGPATLTIWTANVTTGSRLPGLARLLPDPGVLVAQETRLDDRGQQATASACLMMQCHSLFGECCGLGYPLLTTLV